MITKTRIRITNRINKLWWRKYRADRGLRSQIPNGIKVLVVFLSHLVMLLYLKTFIGWNRQFNEQGQNYIKNYLFLKSKFTFEFWASQHNWSSSWFSNPIDITIMRYFNFISFHIFQFVIMDIIPQNKHEVQCISIYPTPRLMEI